MKIEDIRKGQLLAIREELIDIAFEKARKAGLAQHREQVKVTLALSESLETEQIHGEDWTNILSMDLSKVERDFILRLMNGGNKPLNPRDYGLHWKIRRELMRKISGNCPTLRLAKKKPGYCIKRALPLRA